VHFNISEVDGWGVAYHLEIAGADLQDGRSKGFLAGRFTMPDLGEAARTVTLDADLWWSDAKRRVRRSLEYLGPALPAEPPASSPTSTAPAAVPQGPRSPEPSYSSKPTVGNPLAQAVTPESHRPPRQTHTRRATGTQRSVASRDERRGRDHPGGDRHKLATAKTQRHLQHSARGTGPFLNGFAGRRAGALSGDQDGGAARTSTALHGAMLAASGADLDGGFNAAVVVPAGLTLAALTLAGTAFLRRRRLASRTGHD
jgi:hypothetical protein